MSRKKIHILKEKVLSLIPHKYRRYKRIILKYSYSEADLEKVLRMLQNPEVRLRLRQAPMINQSEFILNILKP